jgi:hypothetical protein
VAVLTRPPSTAEIQQLVRSWQAGGRTLWVVGSSAASVVKSAPGVNAGLVGSATSPRQLEMTIQRAPQNYSQGVLTLYAGPVAP